MLNHARIKEREPLDGAGVWSLHLSPAPDRPPEHPDCTVFKDLVRWTRNQLPEPERAIEPPPEGAERIEMVHGEAARRRPRPRRCREV
jgi:hypothetical protein